MSLMFSFQSSNLLDSIDDCQRIVPMDWKALVVAVQREGSIEAADLLLHLLVISPRAGQKSSFFNPDTALQIITRCPSSVLALSHRERVHGAG